MNVIREQKYKNYFSKHNYADWKSLSKLTGVSELTVRRDMRILEKQNIVCVENGGVVITEHSKDTKIELKRNQNKTQKTLIAKKAAKLILKNDYIYIDAGSTTELILDYINQKDIKIATNGLNIAQKALSKGMEVMFIGGKVKPDTLASVGFMVHEQLSKLNFTKAFLGTNGFDQDKGLTTPDVAEAEVKIQVIKKSEKSYVLADASKFKKSALVKFAEMNEVEIITNK